MSPSAIAAGGRRKAPLTREQVIEKIRRWNALYGEPPLTADWNPSVARWRAQEWRAERYRAGDPETGAPWPSLNAAKRHFDGSFDAAVRAAGLVPHRPGPRRRAPGAAVPDVEQRAPTAPRDVDAELVAAAGRAADAERRAVRADDRARRAGERAERAEAKAAQTRERLRDAVRAPRDAARVAARAVRVAEARADKAERIAVDIAARLAEAERVATDAVARLAEAERRTVVEQVAQSATSAPTVATAAGAALAEGRVRAAEQRAVAAASAAEAGRAREALAARRAAGERDAALARAEAAEARARELETTITGNGRTLTAAELAELRDGTGPVGPAPLAAALKELAAARADGDRMRVHKALTGVAQATVRWRDRL